MIGVFFVLIGLSCNTSGGAAEDGFPEYERSVALVRNAISASPRLLELQLILGNVHVSAGRWDEAIRVYEKAAAENPRDWRFSFELGKARLTLEEFGPAIEQLKKALNANPPPTRAVDVRASLAEAHMHTREFANAIEQLRVVARERPRSHGMLVRLGQALDTEARRLRSEEKASISSAGRLEAEAIENLEQALRLSPEFADAHYTLGRLLARLGKKSEAKKHLDEFRRVRRQRKGVDQKRILQSNATLEADTAMDLAKLFASRGAVEPALELNRRALSILSGYEPALVQRGQLCLKARRADEASSAFKKLLEAYPDHPGGLLGLAEVDLLRGKHDSAAQLLLRAAAEHDLASAWERLFRIASAGVAVQGRAEEFARKALRTRPSPDNFMNLATTLFKSGKRDECLKVVRQGLQRYPRHEGLLAALQDIQGIPGGR